MQNLINILIPLLIAVESGGVNYTEAESDRDSAGILQLRRIVVDDVNRILGRATYTYDDRRDPEKAKAIAKVYLEHYGRHYERATGKKVTLEVLARNFNGNPIRGYKNEKTLKYWKLIEAELAKGE